MPNIAIVTGASKGVGRATAEVLANSGFQVIALTRDLKRADFDNENILPYQIDITNTEEIKKFISGLDGQNIKAIVNNSAGSFSNTLILNDDKENWKRAFDINVIAPMELCKNIVPLMKNGGNIINISSIGAFFPNRSSGHYLSSKRAQSTFTEILRLENTGSNIRITDLVPGMIEKGKWLDPEDIAKTIKWILSLPSHINIDSINIMHSNNARY